MVFGNENCKEIVENICPYCNEHLLMNKRSFANHVRWCKKNPKYEQILKSTKNKISKKITNAHFIKHGELKEFHVNCYKCGKDFIIKEYENYFPSKEKYFCSEHCAKSHEHSKETKEKISQSVINYNYKVNPNYKGPQKNKSIKICPVCGKEFKSNNEYCSKTCARKHDLYERISDILKLEDNKQIEEIKKIYKRYCQFTFNLSDFSNEYDFELVKKFGWYKAKNKGNNLEGVSRDHKYSCNEAFLHLIDPYLISHPANCQLLQHNKNISKLDKCSITLEELKNNIKEWNKKYGEYPNKIDYLLFEKLNIKFN